MTVAFMPLVASVVARHGDSRLNHWVLPFLAMCGITSVVWRSLRGDVRPYFIVQFGPLLILIQALWLVRDTRFLVAVLTLYALAKLAELHGIHPEGDHQGPCPTSLPKQ